MRMSRSLAQGRGNMGVLDKTKNIKCTLGGKKGKEKTEGLTPKSENLIKTP